jgi:ubiquinone/menaquinone biosynthesis C-methylase UbiE
VHPRYKHAAAIYDKAFSVFTFGAGPRIHQILARTVSVEPGATIVDVGCGTGLMLPLLRDRVGPEGKVIGIDMTEPMLDRARQRVSSAAWSNVELHCAEMSKFSPAVKADGAVFSLSLSAAEPAEVFHHTMNYLRPGASMVIADGIPASGQWYHPAINFYARIRAPFVGSNLARALEISRLAREYLVDVHIQTIWAGLYTIISGRKPLD